MTINGYTVLSKETNSASMSFSLNTSLTYHNGHHLYSGGVAPSDFWQEFEALGSQIERENLQLTASESQRSHIMNFSQSIKVLLAVGLQFMIILIIH